MSNMKNVNKLTVAFGKHIPAGVLEFTLKDFGRLAIDVEEPEQVPTLQVTIAEDLYIVVDTDTPRGELLMAMECLQDHIYSVDEEELRQNIEADDYHCANLDHIQNHVECYCSQEDCLAVMVYSFTYYAPECIITAYYVIPA